MSSLLIIGGSGFFGKSLLGAYKRGLLDPWAVSEVKVFARNASRLKLTNPNLIDKSIGLYNLDISTAKEIPYADYVIHAAASTDAAKYMIQSEVEKNNIQAGTYNYCELAKKYHRNSKILYCSSGAVYGQQPIGLLQIPENFEEQSLFDMPLYKRGYALAKRDAEMLIKKLGVCGFNVSVARCFAFIGPYLPRNQHFAIGNFLEEGMNGRPIQVRANNLVYRSYMHSDDLILWLMRILDMASPCCPIYNVGSDEEISLQELAKKMAHFFDVSLEIPYISNPNIDRYIPSILRAQTELGLTLKLSLMESVKLTLSEIVGKN